MTVDTTRARLAALQAQITGVTSAFTNIPRAIQDVELPAFITLVGRATYSKQTGEPTVTESRLYTMRLLVKGASLGIEGEAEDETTVFFDRVRDFFYARPQLQLNATSTVVLDSQLTGDSGVFITAYPGGSNGRQLVAIDFTLQVLEIAPISYQ